MNKLKMTISLACLALPHPIKRHLKGCGSCMIVCHLMYFKIQQFHRVTDSLSRFHLISNMAITSNSVNNKNLQLLTCLLFQLSLGVRTVNDTWKIEEEAKNYKYHCYSTDRPYVL